ncbi:hypothetical protein KR50_12230 [Jeotgalibacillus campisalis]|uniref:Uncharacterized protein n=1 Tax=Jeotgalibacillus campisalis TaxID=220754 RepID=A0A0C2VZ09_9BACL|nr:hypothetical protein KR50_12230 [Jeotgalibacillus campisalis]
MTYDLEGLVPEARQKKSARHRFALTSIRRGEQLNALCSLEQRDL